MSSAPVGPPKFSNVYHKRTVGTPKPCYVCNKETSTCLATAETTDWLYTCNSHLADPGFARPIASSTPSSPIASSPATTPPVVPPEEVERVKKEYEEKQKRKNEAAAAAAADAKPADANSSTASTATAWIKTGFSTLSKVATTTQSTLFPAPPTTPASNEPTAAQRAASAKVFALHREVYSMRTDAAKKKWQAAQAKERLKDLSLPAVPRGPIGGAGP